MFLGFCCKVLLRKKGVRVLCGIVLYVTIPLLKAGDIHERLLLLLLLLLLHGGGTGRQSSPTAFLSENAESCDAGGMES